MFLTYIQPSIEIGQFLIDEPVTTLTDLILAAVSFYAFIRIRSIERQDRVKWYFINYFLFLGLGAVTGGLLGHAFLSRIAPGWKLISWVLTIISVGFMLHAMVEMAKPLVKNGFTRVVTFTNWLIMAFAIFLTIRNLSFSPAAYYSALGMLVGVGSLSLFIYLKTGSRGVTRFLLAIGLGLVSVFIFIRGWGVSRWFNHNDISHLILTVSTFVIFKGVTLVVQVPVSWTRVQGSSA